MLEKRGTSIEYLLLEKEGENEYAENVSRTSIEHIQDGDDRRLSSHLWPAHCGLSFWNGGRIRHVLCRLGQTGHRHRAAVHLAWFHENQNVGLAEEDLDHPLVQCSDCGVGVYASCGRDVVFKFLANRVSTRDRRWDNPPKKTGRPMGGFLVTHHTLRV
jgi:hypothetical protein